MVCNYCKVTIFSCLGVPDYHLSRCRVAVVWANFYWNTLPLKSVSMEWTIGWGASGAIGQSVSLCNQLRSLINYRGGPESETDHLTEGSCLFCIHWIMQLQKPPYLVNQGKGNFRNYLEFSSSSTWWIACFQPLSDQSSTSVSKLFLSCQLPSPAQCVVLSLLHSLMQAVEHTGCGQDLAALKDYDEHQ